MEKVESLLKDEIIHDYHESTSRTIWFPGYVWSIIMSKTM